MFKIKYLIIATFAFYLSFQSYPLSAAPTQFHQEVIKEQLHKFFADYYDDLMFESPEAASVYGYHNWTWFWSDLSDEGIADRMDTFSDYLEQLVTFKNMPMSDEDRLSCDIMQYTLENELEGARFNPEYLQINQMDGIQNTISMILNIMPTNTDTDFSHIRMRMEDIPELVDQTIALLRKGVAEGITPPKAMLSSVPGMIDGLITVDPKESQFFQPFTHLPESFGKKERKYEQKEALAIIKNKIYPSLLKLYYFLTNEYIPNCRETISWKDLPDGEAWYRYLVKSFTTTDMTPEQIHAVGLSEVARIKEQMVAILAEINFEGTLNDFFNFLRTDPQFFYDKPENLIKGYQDILNVVSDNLHTQFGKLPKLTFEVVPVPSHSEGSSVAAYYLPGSPKTGRPGQFFANTFNLKARPKWEMEALALHEAVPGHHLQTSIASEMDNVPEFRKIGGFTAYVEGWALYSEGLGYDLGIYQDPYSRFGRLNCEMHRAVRLVVDTGIHALGWTREEAIAYFLENTSITEHEIEVEVDRYIVWPGQALAYKIGELKIREMRSLAEKTLGEQFDIRAFHDAVLNLGAVPMSIFETEMRRWISEQAALLPAAI